MQHADGWIGFHSDPTQIRFNSRRAGAVNRALLDIDRMRRALAVVGQAGAWSWDPFSTGR